MGRKTKQQLNAEREIFFEVKLLSPELVRDHVTFSSMTAHELCKILPVYPKVYNIIRKNIIPQYKLMEVIKDNIDILEYAPNLKLDTYKITNIICSKHDHFTDDDKFNKLLSHAKEQLNIYDLCRLMNVYSQPEEIDRILSLYNDVILNNFKNMHYKQKFILYMHGYVEIEALREDWCKIFDYNFPVIGKTVRTHRDLLAEFLTTKLKYVNEHDKKIIINSIYKINKNTDPIKFRNFYFTNGTSYTSDSIFNTLREQFTDEEIFSYLTFDRFGTMGIEDVVNSNIKSYIDFSKIKNKTVVNKLIAKIISNHHSSEDHICSVRWDTIKSAKQLEYTLFLCYELGNWLTVSMVGACCNQGLLTWDLRQTYGILY